jgi:hypothetical protein
LFRKGAFPAHSRPPRLPPPAISGLAGTAGVDGTQGPRLRASESLTFFGHVKIVLARTPPSIYSFADTDT